MIYRPKGVTIIAVLTLLNSFAMGFLGLMFGILSVVGMGSGLPLTFANLPYYLPWLFALFSFVASVSILFGVVSKYLWYSSITYWIALIIYFVWAYNHMGVWHYMYYLEGGTAWLSWYNILSYGRILSLPSPFICAAGCTAYLLTKTPRQYFHVKQ